MLLHAFLHYRSTTLGLALGLVLWALASPEALAQRGEQCPPWTDKTARLPPFSYCFGIEGGVPVIWLYGAIDANAYTRVVRGLRQTHRYREVWLISTGGFVDEAFKIGLELKQLQASVVIPRRQFVRCVSACTILMLGGHDRTVEPGADFIIHAKSAVIDVSSSSPYFEGRYTWGQVLDALREDKALFRKTAENYWSVQPISSVNYVEYIMEAVGGQPNKNELDKFRSPLPSPYAPGAPRPRSEQQDFNDIRAHGLVALQEILTQLELSAMELMYERMMQEQPKLGRGSLVALRIFKANLACRIQDLCLLEHHQLENLGYHNFTPDRLVRSR